MSDFFHFKFVYLLQLLHLVYPFGLWKIRWGDDKTASNELSKLTSLAELTMFMMKTQHRREYFILSLYFSNDERVKQCRFRVIFESVLASIEWNSTRSKRSMDNSNFKGYGWKDWGENSGRFPSTIVHDWPAPFTIFLSSGQFPESFFLSCLKISNRWN